MKSTQNTTLNLVKFKKLIGKNNQGGEEFQGQQIMPCILIFCVDIFYGKFAKYVKIDLTIISRLVTTWNGVPYFVSLVRT